MIRQTINMHSRAISVHSHQRGAAAIEFAFVLPIMAALLFGVVEFSFALYDKAILTNAAREAARAGIVYAKPRVTTTAISNVASNYAGNLLVTFGNANTPSVSVDQSAGTSAGNPLKVTVSYTYTGLLLGSIVSQLTGPITLSSATTMAYE
jgi:Flp pilus assembly protein TadG